LDQRVSESHLRVAALVDAVKSTTPSLVTATATGASLHLLRSTTLVRSMVPAPAARAARRGGQQLLPVKSIDIKRERVARRGAWQAACRHPAASCRARRWK
jgi:hypothetical protein